MARPKREFDKRQFEQLCRMQCTQKEICSFFETTDKTLTAWCKRTYKKSFSEVYKEKKEGGKISLRHAQWQMAQTNPTMAIWLGKQHLGQSDHQVVAIDNKDDSIREMDDFFANKKRNS